MMAVREDLKESRKEYDKTEDDLKSLQSVGQIIGEVLRQLDEERSEWIPGPLDFDCWCHEKEVLPSGSFSAGRRICEATSSRQLASVLVKGFPIPSWIRLRGQMRGRAGS